MNMDIQKTIFDNRGLVLEKSRLNFGVNGLHSIVIGQNDTRLTRLMITTPEHELWRNHCSLLAEEWDTLSMAIHGGKNNVKIYPLYNNFWITLFIKERKKPNRIIPPLEHKLFQYIWKNPFEFPNQNGFEYKTEEVLTLSFRKFMNVNDDIVLKNNQLYTIYVEPKQISAWIIDEKQGEALYDRLVYSNDTHLSKWDSKSFYQKPSPQQLNEILKSIKLEL